MWRAVDRINPAQYLGKRVPVCFETVVLEGLHIGGNSFVLSQVVWEKMKFVDVTSDSGKMLTGRRGTYLERGAADDSAKVSPQIY